MTSTGTLDVVEKSMQTTNLWLKDIVDELGPDKHRAFRCLSAVLHALRDRLTIEMTAHFSAQLPLVIRGAFFDQWRPTDQPKVIRSREEFLELVNKGLANLGPLNAEHVTKTVFKVLNHYLEPNLVEKVKQSLPEHIRELWL